MTLAAEEAASLRSGAEAVGVSLSGAQLDALGAYLGLLEAWNRRINLVSAKDRGTIVRRHIVDSLAPAEALAKAVEADAEVVDIGSGAGLPGVPLAIVLPGLRFSLLEPRRKRASFLRAAARECFTWNITVEEARASELAVRRPRAFAAAVSRATFAPADLLSEASPLVAPRGLLIAFTTEKTPPAEHDDFAARSSETYALAGAPTQFQLTSWTRKD